MSYTIQFTETNNPSKQPITVQDKTLNNQTSLTFVGKNYSGYGSIISSDFLHILENFASPTAPLNPVQGQLWFNNNAGVSQLNVNIDGTPTGWQSAGGIKKSTTTPTSGVSGDLWVNTSTQQLWVYSGSAWILVGPQYTAGDKTGPDIIEIVDTLNISHTVFGIFANNNLMAIVSKEAFTPKATLTGFPTIGQGINLSTVDVTSTTSPTKIWGTASSADSLNIAGNPVLASNFLRSDIATIANAPLSVRSNGGISIGSDLSFNLGTATNSTILYSKNSGNSIDFRVTNNVGIPSTALHVDSSSSVGIGANNTAPQATLDVAGTAKISGTTSFTDTTDSSALGSGSIVIAGGVSVEKRVTVGDDLTTYGQLYVNYLDNSGSPTPISILQPGSDTASGLYDIGTATRRFGAIYANTFNGNFTGTFVGSVTGNVSGLASGLISPTTFVITGDVSSNSVSYNGQPGALPGGAATFTTSISPTFITGKTATTTSSSTDTLLVYRTGAGAGLYKTTKASFVSNIPTVPIGAVFPFAASDKTKIPTGYLLCDGAEISIGTYSSLFEIIGYTYKRTGLLGNNTFALPDLRGRFPLGPDNMYNGIKVPSYANVAVTIDTIGATAGRVTDSSAATVGLGSGFNQVTISTTNLPDHKHSLQSLSGTQYFAGGLPGSNSDPGTQAGLGAPLSTTGFGLPNSGSVISSAIGQPLNVMNPYLTMNYIIYTGVQ
jgi:microcystin-dependent protein